MPLPMRGTFEQGIAKCRSVLDLYEFLQRLIVHYPMLSMTEKRIFFRNYFDEEFIRYNDEHKATLKQNTKLKGTNQILRNEKRELEEELNKLKAEKEEATSNGE